MDRRMTMRAVAEEVLQTAQPPASKALDAQIGDGGGAGQAAGGAESAKPADGGEAAKPAESAPGAADPRTAKGTEPKPE